MFRVLVMQVEAPRDLFNHNPNDGHGSDVYKGENLVSLIILQTPFAHRRVSRSPDLSRKARLASHSTEGRL